MRSWIFPILSGFLLAYLFPFMLGFANSDGVIAMGLPFPATAKGLASSMTQHFDVVGMTLNAWILGFFIRRFAACLRIEFFLIKALVWITRAFVTLGVAVIMYVLPGLTDNFDDVSLADLLLRSIHEADRLCLAHDDECFGW